jgi:hypothetical protein
LQAHRFTSRERTVSAAIAIDLENDELRPVNSLVERRLGRRLSPATIWRWRTKGVRGVRLECYLIAGHWCSTPAALAEFFRASSEAATPVEIAVTPIVHERSPAKERRLRAAKLL